MIYKCVLFIIRYYDLYSPYKQLGFVDWANERHVPSSTIHLEWLPSEAVQNATFAAARVSFRSLLTPAGLLNVFSCFPHRFKHPPRAVSHKPGAWKHMYLHMKNQAGADDNHIHS